MNAITTPQLSRPRVLEQGAGTRRWLTLLLSVEGLASLAAAITFVALAPDAGLLLPMLGVTGGVALLLLAGVCAVISIMAFTTAASVMRRRDGALAAAAGVQATLMVAALAAGVVNGFDQQVIAGLLIAGIGFVLAGLISRS
jgi:hypothetical protein